MNQEEIEDGVFTEATELTDIPTQQTINTDQSLMMHPKYKTIMRNIKKQTRQLKLSQGVHPTKAKLTNVERKTKRKTQKASRRVNRT